MREQPKLVLVEWEDSAQPVSGWCFLHDAPPLEVVQCQSVGWLVGESDTALMLAPNLGDIETDSPQGSGFIRIPAKAVIRVGKLSEIP